MFVTLIRSSGVHFGQNLCKPVECSGVLTVGLVLPCREAVSYFLTALNQQRKSQRCSHQQMSANIWAALRIAISMMDRPELFQAASIGDLDLLMRVFDVGDV